jgi:preprotein translocase subunit SecF
MKLSVNKARKIWWTVSVVVILIGLIAMGISWQQLGAPLRPSLDFIGGTRIQFELDCSQPQNCDRPISLEEVREVMVEQGLGNSSIQVLGQEQHALSIRTSTLDVEQRTQLQNALSEKIGVFDPEKTQIDTVGPTIGRQLFTSGLLALLFSFAGIIIYISLRYKLDFAVLAIVALFHDVLVTTGVFAILGLVQGVEVDSLFIVALLTLAGFSVNDTVVIYDRIREILKMSPDRPISEVVDDAVNQTLARSINTSLAVMLTLFSIFLFGGETLKYFALALIVGFISGAYSTIFIASTLLAWWRERSGQSRLVPVEGPKIDTSASSEDT